jgi:hypothetical protein
MTFIDTLLFIAIIGALIFGLTRSKDYEKIRKNDKGEQNDD